MKVEEGKFYRAANGEKVGPMVKDRCFYVAGQIGRWEADGTPYSNYRPDLGALVAEWSNVFMEVGRFYVTDSGEKVGPVDRIEDRGRPDGLKVAVINRALGSQRARWWQDGRTNLYLDPEPDTIVAEWVDPEPVREVTRLEVNPGRYGVLDVGPQLNGAVSLAFVGKTQYDATDIQAAIDVLTKIKGALTC